MQTGWCVLLAFALAGCASQPPIAPNGVVSNNPCIDAILAEIALPGQVTAVSSYSHDPDSASAPLAWSANLPAIGMGAEELLLARPKMVLTGNLASSGANAVLVDPALIPRARQPIDRMLAFTAARKNGQSSASLVPHLGAA